MPTKAAEYFASLLVPVDTVLPPLPTLCPLHLDCSTAPSQTLSNALSRGSHGLEIHIILSSENYEKRGTARHLA